MSTETKKKVPYIKFNFHSIRSFMGKLSGSFFVIIAIMPFAGLLLGLGSLLNSFPETAQAAGIFSDLGGALFGNLGLFFAIAIIIGFNKDVMAGVSVVWAYLLFLVYQQFMLGAQNPDLKTIDMNTGVINVLFYHGITAASLATNLGITSLSTGVVGGLIIGGATHVTFNAYKNTKLPSLISFFEGKRIVPLIMIPVAIFVSLIFLVVWPLVSIVFGWIGQNSSKLPGGLDSGIVAFVWRILTPFGIHHAFYSVFWWTAAGGELQMNYHFHWNWGGHNTWITVSDYLKAIGSDSPTTSPVSGDSNLWFFFSKNHIHFNTLFYTGGAVGAHGSGTGLVSGINPGRFLNVNYPFMIGGYLGAGYAMCKMAPLKHKKEVIALVSSGVGTSMLIGVTEPMLFMFIFVAPLLFFGFHALMTAFGAMLMNVLHVHVGSSFSNGALDLIIYGVIQQSLGTNWWWVLIVSAAFVPIYYCVFYLYIKKTGKIFPFIDDDSGSVIQGKDTYRDQLEMNMGNLSKGLGGKVNIKTLGNCATRLRIELADITKIDEKLIKTTGSIAIMKSGNNIQVIYGPKAQKIAQNLKDYLDSPQALETSPVTKKVINASEAGK